MEFGIWRSNKRGISVAQPWHGRRLSPSIGPSANGKLCFVCLRRLLRFIVLVTVAAYTKYPCCTTEATLSAVSFSRLSLSDVCPLLDVRLGRIRHGALVHTNTSLLSRLFTSKLSFYDILPLSDIGLHLLLYRPFVQRKFFAALSLCIYQRINPFQHHCTSCHDRRAQCK